MYNLIALQGERVLEDREVRQPFVYVTEGAPQRQAVQSVIKYTGTLSIPEWMDIEQGSVFDFSSFARGTQVKQTSSRHCAIFRQISLLLRIRHSMEPQA
jgi:hypothetical protein